MSDVGERRRLLAFVSSIGALAPPAEQVRERQFCGMDAAKTKIDFALLRQSTLPLRRIHLLHRQILCKRITLDVCFVSLAPGERHAHVGGHSGPMALVSWIPACAGMTRAHKNWPCIHEMDF